MVFKEPFTTASDVLATFPFSEISEGTGVVTYLGAKTSAGFILTTNSGLASIDPWTAAAAGDILSNVDFDVTFNLPKTIKGKIVVCVPVGVNTGSATIVVTATIYHFDGSTETPLGTDNASVSVTNGDEAESYITLEMDITNTHFAAGTTLRMTLNATRSTATCYVGHDPLGRILSPNLLQSKLLVFVPFLNP